jgi:hypothetical protein
MYAVMEGEEESGSGGKGEGGRGERSDGDDEQQRALSVA